MTQEFQVVASEVVAADAAATTSPATASLKLASAADLIRAAVLGCAGVAGVSAGAYDEVRAYLPGRSVAGIRLDDDVVAVHIVAHYGQPLHEVAEQIGSAVEAHLHGRRLQVAVEDILLPGEALPDEPVLDEPAPDDAA